MILNVNFFIWTFVFLTIGPVSWSFSSGGVSCPLPKDIPHCSCFLLDDLLHVQCSGPDIQATRKALQTLNGPVKSFSVYDLESSLKILPNGFTQNVTSPIFHFQLSHSSLEDLGDLSLKGLSHSLESFSLISGRLSVFPQGPLAVLKRLKFLDLEGNLISQLLPYSFHNLQIQKINLKGNQISDISEHTFWGLEDLLIEMDLSENKLKIFPYTSLQRFHLLESINLAWNEISDLSLLSKEDRTGPEWPALKYFNLNSNLVRRLERNSFSSMDSLKSLSIHSNSIESIDEIAFTSLKLLESIDLSQNKITILGGRTFRSNLKLTSIDLSNNHLHLLSPQLFNNLQELRELFLNGNNLQQLSSQPFLGSSKIAVLYLQGNALKFIESSVFTPLTNLSEIRLSDNFLKFIPQDLFSGNVGLISVSLDGNSLRAIEPGTFDNCKNLRELRLQNNEIGEIPSGVLDNLSRIEEIHLENNKLGVIKGLIKLKKVRHVSLSRNHIEKLTGEMLPGTELSSLSLGHNNLRWIEEGSFKNQNSLSILYLGENRISRLKSRTFEGLKNLERLYLQRNNLSYIEDDTFSSQTKSLQYLDLSHNFLSSLSNKIFANLPSIVEINLSFNAIGEISDGSFALLRNLRILDLSGNRIHTLEFPQPFAFSRLEILKIGDNYINEIKLQSPQSGAPPLKDLDLSGNSITSYAISLLNLPQLEVLNLNGNNLSSTIDPMIFSGFPNLNYISVEKCRILTLPPGLLKSTPNLSVLKLSDNLISILPDDLFSARLQGQVVGQGQGLRELHLRSNRIRNFPYKTLWNISTLEILTLGGNRVGNIEFSKILLPRLKQLDLNDNRLGKITSPQGGLGKALGSIEVIDFGLNNITKVAEDFLENVHLTQLNMGGNSFSKIPSAFSSKYISSDENPSKGYLLNMSSNPLVDFYPENHGLQNYSVLDLYLVDTNVTYLNSDEFKIYPKLHRLVIRKNPISAIPLGGFSSLKLLNLLDLSENDLFELNYESFSGLVQLKSLNISGNRVKNLGAFHRDLAGLQDLDLSYNQLTHISAESLQNLQSLVSLRLRGNWLSGFGPEIFAPLGRLSTLDLSHNFIENVPSLALRHLETRLTTLKLEENPLDCGCESKELWEWLHTHPKIFVPSNLGLLAGISVDTLQGSTMGGFLGGSAGFLSKGVPNFICDRPEEVRGRAMLESDILSLCSAQPTIVKVAIDDIKPSSFTVSWLEKNNSGLQGIVIAYHALDPLRSDDGVRTRTPPQNARAFPLTDLHSDTPYLVCVLGLSQNLDNESALALTTRTALKDSQVSKCAQIRTLVEYPPESSGKMGLLQRRLGVIVGSSVAIIFFIVLIISFAIVNVKKRREFTEQIDEKEVVHLGEALCLANNVGTLGGYHQNQSNNSTNNSSQQQLIPSNSSLQSQNLLSVSHSPGQGQGSNAAQYYHHYHHHQQHHQQHQHTIQQQPIIVSNQGPASSTMSLNRRSTMKKLMESEELDDLNGTTSLISNTTTNISLNPKITTIEKGTYMDQNPIGGQMKGQVIMGGTLGRHNPKKIIQYGLESPIEYDRNFHTTLSNHNHLNNRRNNTIMMVPPPSGTIVELAEYPMNIHNQSISTSIDLDHLRHDEFMLSSSPVESRI